MELLLYTAHIFYLIILTIFVIWLFWQWQSIRHLNQIIPPTPEVIQKMHSLERSGIIWAAILSFFAFLLSHANLSYEWTGKIEFQFFGAYWVVSWVALNAMALAVLWVFSKLQLRIAPLVLTIILFLSFSGLVVLDNWSNRYSQMMIGRQIGYIQQYASEYDLGLEFITDDKFEELYKENNNKCYGCANIFNETWLKTYRENLDTYHASLAKQAATISYKKLGIFEPHTHFIRQVEFILIGFVLLVFPVVGQKKYPKLMRLLLEKSSRWVGLSMVAMAGFGTLMVYSLGLNIPAIPIGIGGFAISVTDIIKLGLVVYLSGFLSTHYRTIENQLISKNQLPWLQRWWAGLKITSKTFQEPFWIIIPVIVLTLIGKDWGGVLLMGGIVVFMLFLGAGPKLRAQQVSVGSIILIILLGSLIIPPFWSPIIEFIGEHSPEPARNLLSKEFQEVSDRVSMWQCPANAYEDAEATNQLQNLFTRDIIKPIEKEPIPISPLVSQRVQKITSELRFQVNKTIYPYPMASSAPPTFTQDPADAILLQTASELLFNLKRRSIFKGAIDPLYLNDLSKATIKQLNTWSTQFANTEKETLQTGKPYNLEDLITPKQDNYQLVMAFYALQSGGLMGQGFGKGMPETIPGLDTDFIFVGWTESTGGIGSALILSVMGLFILILLQSAARQTEMVRQLMLAGLSSIFTFQIIVIVGGDTGLLPLTGITMPFMARSGVSILVSFLIVGIALAYSDNPNPNIEQQTGMVIQNFSQLVFGFLVALGIFVLILMIRSWVAVLISFLITIMVFVYVGRPRHSPEQETAIVIRNFSRLVLGLFIVLAVFTSMRVIYNVQLNMGGCHPSADFSLLPTNPRSLGVSPGAIRTTTGYVLAKNSQTGGRRIYNTENGALSHVIQDIEIYYADALAGDYQGNKAKSVGFNVVTTVSSELQKVVDTVLTQAAFNKGIPSEELRAAVVLIDVSDEHAGAVLAMESRPTFEMGLTREQRAQLAVQDRDELLSPMVNRAINGTYPPGSIFKVITAAEALDLNIAKRTDVIDITPYNVGSGVHKYPKGSIPGVTPVYDANCYLFDKPTLQQSLAFSCNSVFAILAEKIGPKRFIDYGKRFGFETEISLGQIPVAKSTLDNNYESQIEPRYIYGLDGLLHSGYGQGQLSVTPLHMALVAATIARKGEMPTPFLVNQIEDADGKILMRASPSSRRVIPQSVAGDVAIMMKSVVEEGSAIGLLEFESGEATAAKTGTAENGNYDPHSWLIGFWPYDKPKIAFAIVFERGGEGSKVAVPIAGDILDVISMILYRWEDK